MTEPNFPRRHAATQRFTLGAPRSIRVAKDDSRIVFARSTAGDDPVNRLWSLDLDTGEETMVADPVTLLAGTEAELTDEEKARRERAREAGGGIVTWNADRNLTTAVYVLGGRTFLTDIVAATTQELATAAGAFDPRLSPSNELVAYVAGGELRIHEIAKSAPAADSSARTDADRSVVRSTYDGVSWGVAEFIAAEEMGRSRGFWWGPDDRRLLVTRVDNRRVDEWTIASPVEPWTPARTIRYPAAGKANATVGLAIVDLHAPDATPAFIDWRQGEFEYLAGVSWGSRSTPTLTVQTRDQRTAAILSADAETGKVSERYRWTDPLWVELVPGSPTWADDKLLTVEDRGSARRLVVDGDPITADDLQVLSIVSAGGAGNGAATAIVTATQESSETHVFIVNLITGTAEQLSPEPGVHSIAVGTDANVLQSATLLHFGTVARINDGRIIESHAERPSVEPTPQIMRAGKRELRTALLLPRHVPDTPLPVLLDPYGGPHARRVLRARNMFLTSQWFADQGFAVIVTDGRGTPARGPAFEREVYGDLAGPILEDQIEALEAMQSVANLDMSKVGIRGWSFGGYLAALAVMRRPDVFHAGIAGAPVTDWRLYDTHYTERYMGHPQTAPEHYDACDLCAEAASLTRPLMLIHGLADDNVVAAHTLSLSRALLEAGRPHQVLPLSGVTHMTPQEAVAENLLRLQLTFLRDSLGLTAGSDANERSTVSSTQNPNPGTTSAADESAASAE